ncbi:MAG: rRNA maturation RNase YbeY [Spirochaetaceae bacterium]|jgi:probable rRNA maturation factor|nr:rRNA maturation RNase YbeY [Spirochaetaceae bacterium]
MNRVDIAAAEVPLPAWVASAERFILQTLERIDRHNWDISILFCNDKYIQTLNRRYRNKDEATDVLSFCAGGMLHEDGEVRHIAGDIVISLETLTKNSKYFDTCEDEELRRLLIHGILHLNGLNHTINDIKPDALEAEPMLFLQEKIISELSDSTILC